MTGHVVMRSRGPGVRGTWHREVSKRHGIAHAGSVPGHGGRRGGGEGESGREREKEAEERELEQRAELKRQTETETETE
eukprot:3726076-Rhodomonas_salina.2